MRLHHLAFLPRRRRAPPLVWRWRPRHSVPVQGKLYLIANPVGGELMWIKHARNQEPSP